MRPCMAQDHVSFSDLRHLQYTDQTWCKLHDEGGCYLNDCPQRNVVFRQSSVKLVGSLYHSAARNAMVMCKSRVDTAALMATSSSEESSLAGALRHAKGRFSMNCSFSQRQQHHHPLEHHVLVSGLLRELSLLHFLISVC